MIEDRALLDYMRGLAVSLDPIERFRLAVGEPDEWQKVLLRTDHRLNVGEHGRPDDRMVLALCGRQSGKSTTCGCLAYDDFAKGKTVILTAPSLRQSTELFRRILEFKNSDPCCPPIVRQTQTELEAHPEFTGRGFEQQLGDRRCTVVFQESIQLYSYTDLADHVARRLSKIPNWTLAIDASGLGGPFSSTLDLAGIEHFAVTMTAGASLSRKGRDVTVAKTLLLENLAVGLETHALTIAHDLPGKQDLLNEVASFELASTSAGNLVLQGGGKGHHADRAVALALAYLSVTHLDLGMMPVQQKLVGWR
ncbi:hypothetical protein [Tabrizicola fusiformis]|uniref:hypothetical protein n=1 Tax=Tabrizicola sp. SY72 TaxID=2741673 RepID=UPI0015728BCD|nr:hypothetical protein [Tabrizicola sp. SY72]NTT87756.1 hypothetical protein [Tabrizicola sp. SY72]